jgi:protein involved in polysaccharide export with SLBB domain
LYRLNSSVQTPDQKREMDRLLRDLDAGSGVTSTKLPTAANAQDANQQNVNILSSQVARAITSEKSGKIIILTPPRSMVDQQLALTIPVEADKIINSKGKNGDIILMPGDSIYVPDIPTTVTVLGGVFSNGSVVFDKNKNLSDYVNAVGGFSKDAETNHLVVLRMNGMVLPVKKSSKILPGDIIIVPTTFVVKNIRTDSIFEASLRTLSELAISYMPFKK